MRPANDKDAAGVSAQRGGSDRATSPVVINARERKPKHSWREHRNLIPLRRSRSAKVVAGIATQVGEDDVPRSVRGRRASPDAEARVQDLQSCDCARARAEEIRPACALVRGAATNMVDFALSPNLGAELAAELSAGSRPA